MLKRDALAKKYSTTVLSTLKKDPKEGYSKTDILLALENAYVLGFDLAVEECLKDNSKYGFVMGEMLKTLEEDNG